MHLEVKLFTRAGNSAFQGFAKAGEKRGMATRKIDVVDAVLKCCSKGFGGGIFSCFGEHAGAQTDDADFFAPMGQGAVFHDTPWLTCSAV